MVAGDRDGVGKGQKGWRKEESEEMLPWLTASPFRQQ